jgi:hypothetical protein
MCGLSIIFDVGSFNFMESFDERQPGICPGIGVFSLRTQQQYLQADGGLLGLGGRGISAAIGEDTRREVKRLAEPPALWTETVTDLGSSSGRTAVPVLPQTGPQKEKLPPSSYGQK